MKENQASDARNSASAKSNAFLSKLVDTVSLVVGTIVAFIVAYSLFLTIIPSGSWINVTSGESMHPTLNNGQIIFSDFGDVNRGDIITLTVPEDAPNSEIARGKTLVKRVVGIPGDKIQITSDGVFINGELINEPYLTTEAAEKTYERGRINEVALGENEYFVMGDNRGASCDSRMFGVIGSESILYRQSENPTLRFYVTLLVALVLFGLTCVAYATTERIMKKVLCDMFSIERHCADDDANCDVANGSGTTNDVGVIAEEQSEKENDNIKKTEGDGK